MSESAVELRCHCCGGTGRVALSPVYARTLALLRRQEAPLTGADMARLDGSCRETSMCNRLVRLEAHGLAVCVGGGRGRKGKFWKAT